MTFLQVPEHGEWLQTRNGVAFDLLHPRADMVRTGDVAHHLAQINRFVGALERPYSVAQHSLLVFTLLSEAGHRDPRVLLQGLVHDAAEAYVGDVSAPLKRLLPDYRRVEARVWAACAGHFGVSAELDPAVKAADWTACCLEAWEHGHRAPVAGWAGGDPRPQVSSRVLHVLRMQEPWTLMRNAWLDKVEGLRECV